LWGGAVLGAMGSWEEGNAARCLQPPRRLEPLGLGVAEEAACSVSIFFDKDDDFA
jgi:hypothetical protein